MDEHVLSLGFRRWGLSGWESTSLCLWLDVDEHQSMSRLQQVGLGECLLMDSDLWAFIKGACINEHASTGGLQQVGISELVPVEVNRQVFIAWFTTIINIGDIDIGIITIPMPSSFHKPDFPYFHDLPWLKSKMKAIRSLPDLRDMCEQWTLFRFLECSRNFFQSENTRLLWDMLSITDEGIWIYKQ